MSESVSQPESTKQGSTEPEPTTIYSSPSPRRRTTVRDLAEAKRAGRRWVMLTCYDALTAQLFDEAGVPVLLVGDSAANVVFGHDSTLPITVDDLIPLVQGVSRGSHNALVVADLPFGSYQANAEQALQSATRFLKEAGAHAVKLEGGVQVLPQVEALVAAGIPVMAHLGLTPQSVHALGGYRVQGRGEAGQTLLQDAKAMQAAGAFAVVLELVPSELAAQVTASLAIPTVGIGAGPQTDAQVLVWQDLLGLTPNPAPRFVRRYADLRGTITDAVCRWTKDVETGRYPAADESYR